MSLIQPWWFPLALQMWVIAMILCATFIINKIFGLYGVALVLTLGAAVGAFFGAWGWEQTIIVRVTLLFTLYWVYRFQNRPNREQKG